ncbi:MAG: 3-deoxy-manno-octulosonate cytidylyltransferase, partial [bacterium]
MSVLCVIPARYASTRFPGKVLREINGKPLVKWVWEAARSAKKVDRVIIATENTRVAKAAKAWGAEMALTSQEHPSGTDRVAEVASRFPADIIINLQGDEPLMRGPHIDTLVQSLLEDGSLLIATLATPCPPDEVDMPSVVKVVTNARGNALYFSRSPIPYPRNGKPGYLKHLGIYGYRAATLRKFVRLPQT